MATPLGQRRSAAVRPIALEHKGLGLNPAEPACSPHASVGFLRVFMLPFTA